MCGNKALSARVRRACVTHTQRLYILYVCVCAREAMNLTSYGGLSQINESAGLSARTYYSIVCRKRIESFFLSAPKAKFHFFFQGEEGAGGKNYYFMPPCVIKRREEICRRSDKNEKKTCI